MSDKQGARGVAVTIAGAGLAGSLLACLLAQRGYAVRVLERMGDPRHSTGAAGRSINLALAERGRYALRQAGLEEQVMAIALPMRGRQVHAVAKPSEFHAYGLSDSEAIWSLQRARLNCLLLDAAERAGARLRFDAAVADIDFAARRITLEQGGAPLDYQLLVGADGADSAVRKALARQVDLGQTCQFQEHGYKELEIPPAEEGGFRLNCDALHIWPRGGHMCIALPNIDGSFTATLFLHLHSEQADTPNFAALGGAADAQRWFAQAFPELHAMMPNFVNDYDTHPVGKLGTLSLQKWHAYGNAVLLGDAAHPMVPFHGQGMNCALEDAVALTRHLLEGVALPAALAAYQAECRPNAGAIQTMALENYTEMSQRVSSAEFALERQLSSWLERRYPERFVSRYRMVTFSRMPYLVALERGKLQADLLRQATQGRRSFEEIDLTWVAEHLRECIPRMPAAFNLPT